MTVLLLVVVGTFAALPGLTASFDDPVDVGERQIADRLADTTVAWNSSTTGPQTVHYDGLVDTLQSGSSFATLTESVGIPSNKFVNVTLESGGKIQASGGSTFRDDPAATTVRIVRTHETTVCEPTCRLIVRVW
jgi:hypothetical protein